jgi:radical SAM protein with 4Fe4S-binding SPASM domain
MAIVSRFIANDRNPEAQQNFEDYSPRRCSAGKNYLTVAPDGSAYTCMAGMNFNHSTLYTGIVGEREVSHFRMGNFFDPNFQLRKEGTHCAMPCNSACDRDSVIVKKERTA